ncbi:MAG: response regulator [Elusimicrobiota bacterium]
MKILICDDEYATRLITKSFLDMHSYDTVEAANGFEAFEVIKREAPDLLIIDYSMPGKTGLEVIRELDGRLPSIVLTSEGFTELTEKELKEQASAYIIKPVTEEKLIETVKRVMGGD